MNVFKKYKSNGIACNQAEEHMTPSKGNFPSSVSISKLLSSSKVFSVRRIHSLTFQDVFLDDCLQSR